MVKTSSSAPGITRTRKDTYSVPAALLNLAGLVLPSIDRARSVSILIANGVASVPSVFLAKAHVEESNAPLNSLTTRT